MEQSISLKQLVISPLNVRKVRTTKEEDAQLRALIESQGLLQNLIVIPSADIEGRFEVVAGGRRLTALNHLLAEEKIDHDYPVRCIIKTRQAAIEASLAENFRSDMHPADKFVAYKAMADEGKSVVEIAKQFGHSETDVKKLLKLGNVAPDIVDAFRGQDLSLECVMAFTVSDDHKEQMAVYEDVKDGYSHPSDIRRRLLNSTMKSDDATILFIGIDAYKEAGGTVSSDLFAEVEYIDDTELAESLAQNKFDELQEREIADGWTWVESSLRSQYSHPLAFAPSVKPELFGVPNTLTDRLTQLYQCVEDLSQTDPEHWTDDETERQQQYREEIDALEEEQEGYRSFTDEQKAKAGVLISLDFRTGEPVFRRGIVVKGEAESTESAENGEQATTTTPADESQALKRDLEAYHLQALQSELMSSPDLCSDLATFSIAQSQIRSSSFWVKPMSISLDPTSYDTKDIDETKAAKKVTQAYADLNLGWTTEETPREQFEAFQKLGAKEKQAILAYCTALTVRSASNPIMEAAGEQLGFCLSDHWQPTKANYFNRVKRDKLLELLVDFKGQSFAEQQASTKKGELAEIIESLDEVKGWLPPSMLNDAA